MKTPACMQNKEGKTLSCPWYWHLWQFSDVPYQASLRDASASPNSRPDKKSRAGDLQAFQHRPIERV